MVSATRAFYREIASGKLQYAQPQRDFGKVKEEDWEARWKDPETKLVHFIGKDNIFLLNVGEGKLHLVANGIKEFESKLKDVDQVNKWFMIELIEELKNSGQYLNDRQVYSYRKLPVLGGDYSAGNFEATDIEVHFCVAGQIHERVKDLPPGTKIGKVNFTSRR